MSGNSARHGGALPTLAYAHRQTSTQRTCGASASFSCYARPSCVLCWPESDDQWLTSGAVQAATAAAQQACSLGPGLRERCALLEVTQQLDANAKQLGRVYADFNTACAHVLRPAQSLVLLCRMRGSFSLWRLCQTLIVPEVCCLIVRRSPLHACLTLKLCAGAALNMTWPHCKSLWGPFRPCASLLL